MLAQEWLAEFITYKGIVFPEFSYDIHVRAHHFEPGLRTQLWVDVGFTNPYAVLPVHRLVFGRMLQGLRRAAEARTAGGQARLCGLSRRSASKLPRPAMGPLRPSRPRRPAGV